MLQKLKDLLNTTEHMYLSYRRKFKWTDKEEDEVYSDGTYNWVSVVIWLCS